MVPTMPQLNVYIPEDLAEALQRHREALNLSQICARALRQEVQKMEAPTHPHQRVNIALALNRLRGQQQRQAAAYQDGTADAARWIEEEASLEDLRRYGEWTPESDPGSLDKRANVDVDAFYDHVFQPEVLQAAPWYRRREEAVTTGGLNPVEYWPAYRRGWHETVIAAWQEIAAQL
jgi:hypothetical protein